jgi:hypothetical protein
MMMPVSYSTMPRALRGARARSGIDLAECPADQLLVWPDLTKRHTAERRGFGLGDLDTGDPGVREPGRTDHSGAERGGQHHPFHGTRQSVHGSNPPVRAAD